MKSKGGERVRAVEAAARTWQGKDSETVMLSSYCISGNWRRVSRIDFICCNIGPDFWKMMIAVLVSTKLTTLSSLSFIY